LIGRRSHFPEPEPIAVHRQATIDIPKSKLPFRPTPIAAIVTGLALLASPSLHAADEKTVAQLQSEIDSARAEIARLNALLAQSRQGAAAPADAASAAAPAPVAAAEAVPATEDKSAQPQVVTSASVPADGTVLEGIVVSSAHPKLEIVEDLPQSVSVISGNDLASTLALDLGAIVNRAANVNFNVGNSRTFSLSIRGVGKVTQTEAQDTSVGVILDGIPIAYAPFASFDLYDVDTVEVARGPQGTDGGKNFTVGTIAINTRNPSFTPDARWSIALGQRDTVISQVAGGGPVIDNVLAWRGALVVDKGNGQYANAYYPDQTYFNTDRVAGRIKLLYTPTADFSALATAEIQPEGAEFYNSEVVNLIPPATYANNGVSTKGTGLDVAGKLGRSWFTDQNGGQNFYYGGAYLNTATPDVNAQQPLYTFTNNASLELKKTFGDLELSSITGVRRYHFEARNDDATPFNISINGGGKVDLYKEATQEFSLGSHSDLVDWKTGAFFWYNHVNYDGQGGWSSGWGSDAGAYYASTAQYAKLDTTAAGQLLMENSLENMNKSATQIINNRSEALYGQADWHVTHEFTLTTGARLGREDRLNNTSSLIVGNGNGGALNPVVTATGVSMGGFASNSTTGALLGGNSAAQIALANSVAQQYFGVNQYSLLTTKQQGQVAAAKAVRAGQIGTVWDPIAAPEYRRTLPGLVLTPSYKFTPNETAYLATQLGEKGGVSQVVNAVPVVAGTEKAESIELGLKSASADRQALANVDIFKTIIHNYQQTVSTLDPLNIQTTVSYVGTAPQVDIWGVEFDAAVSVIRNLRLRASGAFNLAKYRDFPDSPLPAEDQVVGTHAFQDVSGQRLPGASKILLNVGADYRLPLPQDKLAHAGFNTAFLSRYNSDSNLSAYAWIPGHSTTDANIGWGRQDEKFDVSVIVKNLFNNLTPQAQTLNSITPGYTRWLGVQFTGKL